MNPLTRWLNTVKCHCPDWQQVSYATIVTLSALSAIVFLCSNQANGELNRASDAPLVQTQATPSAWH
ncbi:MAG: hypothetical protein AAF268_03495 [Cyanobacteria bacterium P01_A01_bin.3]